MGLRLFKFFLAYLGIFAAIALALFLVIFLWRQQFDRFIAEHPLGLCSIVSALILLVSLSFFKLQDIIMVFPPEPDRPPVSGQELLSRLENAFTRPVDGKPLFDFMRSGNRAVITWSSSVSYFQGTSAGIRGMKRVIVLTLDEGGHDVYYLMKDKDWQWSLSRNFTEFSLNYSTGLFAEYRDEAYPSIEFADGGLRVDMKRLTYSSDQLWQPIRTAVLSSGWTLRGGMLPSLTHRLVFCTTLGLLAFLAMAGIFKGLGATGTAEKRGVEPPPREESRPAGKGPDDSPLAGIVAATSTEQIRVTLKWKMKTLPGHLADGRQVGEFLAFARAYLARPDRDGKFAATLAGFAQQHHLDLGN